MRLQAGGGDYPGKHTMPGIYRYLHVVSSHTRVPQTVACVPPAASAHLKTHALFRSSPGSGYPHRCSPVRTSAFVRTQIQCICADRASHELCDTWPNRQPGLRQSTTAPSQAYQAPKRAAARRCDVCALVSALSVVSLTHCAMQYTAILQLIGGPSHPSVFFWVTRIKLARPGTAV